MSTASIVDLTGDGKPEIMDSGPVGQTGCMDCEPGCSVPEEYQAEVAREYHRIVGGFDDMNFTYGFLLEIRAPWSLFLFQPLRIFEVSAAGIREVTTRYASHLRWRLDLLRRLRAVVDDACKEQVDATITYLRKRLEADAER